MGWMAEQAENEAFEEMNAVDREDWCYFCDHRCEDGNPCCEVEIKASIEKAKE